MATYTFAQTLTKLNTLLRDTANTTFTNAEKTELLTEVIENDPACIKIARDTSLTTGSTTTTSWTVPTQFEEILDFGIDYDSDGVPEYLDRSAWEVVDGTIYVTSKYTPLPTSKTIYLVGTKRLLTSDSIPDYLVKYILEKCAAELFEMLASIGGTRFLKNDITMAELRQKVAAHEAKAARYESRIRGKRLIVV